jgi:monooxygenase
VIYRGCMLSGIPNLAFEFGYTNASWTLRCDLISQLVCRLLAHMDEHGYVSCAPRQADPSMSTEPFADFSSGYILRSIELFPKQGSKPPWRLHQNYLLDWFDSKARPIDDPGLEFSRAHAGDRPAGAAERPMAAAA